MKISYLLSSNECMPESKKILTGLRVNSTMTLGNYLGAILPMVQRQKSLSESDEFFMFIPDLHSFTTPIDHTKLYGNILEGVKVYLASGIDPLQKNTVIYRQSQVPAHSELTWILSCFTYMGELKKMTQFKEKSGTQKKSIPVGLFIYPILMAADILLYGADYIPLGDDQKQHLEITRDIAIRINNKFQHEIFNIPKPWNEQIKFNNLTESVRIRSLQKPEKKMSKSIDDPKGTILVTDDPMQAAKKVMSAATDSLGEINWDWKNQPGITNLLQIYSLLSGQTIEEVKKTWTGKNQYGELKKITASEVQKFLTDLQLKMSVIENSKIEKILFEGEKKANIKANQTLKKVQRFIGTIS